MAEQITPVEPDAPTITFLKDKHELTKLLKSLEKASQKAVEYLITVLNAPDTGDGSVDPKLKVAAADKIIGYYTATQKQVNDDDMARLVAELRMNQPKRGPFLANPEDKPAPPVLDFNNVREIS